ncbi:GMC family oxidoreductase N-terminal domain-containing protein [Streptomyces sp. Je 1-4]|uniref:GMC family oxidoreductase n=1 Tax=Streptomyces TaxID=1883 RepID=UPI0021DB3035|nr:MULTISPECIES: GMC family oxidoreductase N-terminal domain-containing protein [unclassified Streptomyces]UYB38603.1 GMC family oxidoreductase N-terminal domain-containing protein [Streptomyces sp. Je 1-4]UZQ34571.1 GMC family oxidoreductase N-terminal domain-containing protein [Streptomyces sp. Je 1-4] [Streptomyces sp. Je 1-4 4N24]UZQ41989.1 GMC family oxidoreductase N-terminal domain-containing protein [Streptomyces sp. Je 1-4] [Streptomyces sp. Je 1-4 4N24_ara]
MRQGFDDIVVGAGAAGVVLAACLSEDPARRVLLIEAGPDHPDPAHLPADLRNGCTPSLVEHDWSLVGERRDGALLPLPRGRVVGGSSAVNSCIALRPEVDDFTRWAKRAGGAAWSWPEILPFFTALESDADFGERHHGAHGPLPLRRPSRSALTPLSAALVETATAAGHPFVADHNAPGATGVGPLPLNLADRGRRVSAVAAYLDPVRKRPNLTVLADTLVDRVLFEGTRARGVVTVADGGTTEVRGDRVTLCAGAYGTPALLHRSGIGPAALLRSLGVDVVADLPGVGNGLSDHSQVPIGVIPPTAELCDPSVPCAQVVLRYTAPGSDVANDMQMYVLNHVELDVYAPHLASRVPGGRAFMVTANLMAPRGRGTVTTVARSPAIPPRIGIDYTADAEDLRRLRAGVGLCWEMLQQPAFTALTRDVIDMDAATVRSQARLDAFVRRAARTAHHPMGTARIGRADDPDAVVDERCRVYGTERLQVADASVIPVPVRANTHLVSLVIGERVAAWSRQAPEAGPARAGATRSLRRRGK